VQGAQEARARLLRRPRPLDVRRLRPNAPPTARRVELVAGAIFVVAGIPKFAAFGWELDAFRRFGLPVPEVWVVAAGMIELAGGVALLAGRCVWAAALLLATTMGVAFVASGVLQGDVIPSLTLAPALLAACLYLLWVRRPRERPRPS
jgi:uncharacterized membrane protein YphA (DoxX/SURF4 family)